MKQSKLFMPTLREVPRESDVLSQQVLLRGGYIRQLSSGVYSYLPLANFVLNRLKKIIREEFAKIDANEMLLPSFIPKQMLKRSEQYNQQRRFHFEVSDNEDRDYVLGHSHEAVFLSLIKDAITSYKKLPITLYQFKEKFRDEVRAKQGLMRTREFLMSDACSFHYTTHDLETHFKEIEKIYLRIFERCGVKCYSVVGKRNKETDFLSKEFLALTEHGDQTIVYSDASDYAAKLEMATSEFVGESKRQLMREMALVETPNIETIAEVASYFEITPDKILKTLLLQVDDRLVMVLLRGDHEISLYKVGQFLKAEHVQLAKPEQVEKCYSSSFGSLGPINDCSSIEIVADLYVETMMNFVCGATKTGYHFKDVNINRDVSVSAFSDFKLVKNGEPSPDGLGILHFAKAVELGHIFQVGDYLSYLFDAMISDEQGKKQPILMGSYRLGLSRLFATIVDTTCDEEGITWPTEVAPFDMHLILVKMTDEAQVALAEELEETLSMAGFSVLVDDRNERTGVKYKDADLVGAPYRITIGDKAEEGIVEVKLKKTAAFLEVRKEELLETLKILNQ
ncbi:proline--tRNA ligase [Vagococcus sp.]|uniref:proline--tRNA ligase n=1 Tax=Vagococcus sp. TaxID=1933889 RepID=UPI003F9DADAD